LGAAVGWKDVDERAVRPSFEAAEEHPMPSEHSELLPFPKAFRMVGGTSTSFHAQLGGPQIRLSTKLVSISRRVIEKQWSLPA